MCFEIIYILLLPIIAILWSTINYLIVKFICYLTDKWDIYQINKMTKEIQKMNKLRRYKNVKRN